jgi:hypothetical protein
MDQLTPPVVTDTNNKTNKPIKKKAALFFSKFSSQKSIAQNQSHGSLSKQNPQNQTQFAIIENQNLSVLPVNLSVASVSLDNQLGDNKNMEAILQISHPREQQTEDLSFTKIQSSNTALVATEKPLLCRRMTKLYQFSQVHQSPISVSDRNSKNSSNIPICRKQLYPLILQKGHYSNSTPLKLYTTLDAITAVEQSYTNNTEQCIGCAGFNRQGNLTPIKESSQTCSRAISAFPLEKDPHSPDSKYPNSTASSIYYRSDEEEAITPSSSECNSTQWTSTDSNTYRYYKSRRSKSHGDYLITIKDPDALCTSEPSSSTSSCYSQNDSDRTDLDRSTSVSSLTSSCSSNISKSQRPALSSKSIFGKSESQKKESKAIAMWHSTVHNLTTKRKSLDRQPEKPKVNEL